MSTHHEDAHADGGADDPKEIGRHANRICVGVTVPDSDVHDETDDGDVTEDHTSSTGVHDIISTLYQLSDLVMLQTIETDVRSFHLIVSSIVLYLLFLKFKHRCNINEAYMFFSAHNDNNPELTCSITSDVISDIFMCGIILQTTTSSERLCAIQINSS